jgi:hypothetical protein
MRLPTIIGRSAEHDATLDELRAARITAARGCQAWTEIDGPLVARGPWWVHPDSDRLFTQYRGVAFATGSVSLVADRAELVFTVHGDELSLYERVFSPASWTEHVERQAKRQQQRAAS